MLQDAFESNWYGPGGTRPRKKRTKRLAKQTVVVMDDEDKEKGEKMEDKSKVPMPLDRALTKPFTYDSTNPNVAASASAPGPAVVPAGCGRRHAPRL